MISNSMDYIDSRDVLERIEELEDELENLDPEASGLDVEEIEEELELLNSLKDEWGDDESFEWGIQFIHEDYFEDYARELAWELGYITNDKEWQWPYSHINWSAAAEELKIDYQEIDFDGVTYYGRE